MYLLINILLQIQGLNRYGQLEDEIDNIRSYDTDIGRWIIQDAYVEGPVFMQEPYVPQRSLMDLTPRTDLPLIPLSKSKKTQHSITEMKPTGIKDKKKLKFALTPLDKGYFERDTNSTVPRKYQSWHLLIDLKLCIMLSRNSVLQP